VTSDELKASVGILGGAMIGSLFVGALAYYTNLKTKLETCAKLNLINDAMTIKAVFDLFHDYDTIINPRSRMLYQRNMIRNVSVETLPVYETDLENMLQIHPTQR
jgi:esterase/lipase